MGAESLSIRVLHQFLAGISITVIAQRFQIPAPRLEERFRNVLAAVLSQTFKYRQPLPADRPICPFESQLKDIWTNWSTSGTFTEGDAAAERAQQTAYEAAQAAGDWNTARFHMALLMERAIEPGNETRSPFDSSPDEDRPSDQVGRLAK